MTHEWDELSGGIMITDAKGKILYANKVITSSKGFFFDQIYGKKPGELWGGKMDEHFYKELWETIQERKLPFYGKVRNVDKTGFTNLEGLHIAPILNGKGETEFFLEIQPTVLNPTDEQHFHHEFESVIQNQQKHPEALWNLMERWLSASPSSLPSPASGSPANFLESLVEQHAETHLDEDQALIDLAKTDPTYFRRLYEKYQSKIFNYFLYRVGRNRALAEDLSQETFARAFDALSHFEYRGVHYLSYLLMVAHNLLVNYYRMAKPIFMENIDLLPNRTESTVEKEAEIQLIWEAVHHLAPVERAILTMKYNQDLPVKEIAKKLHKSENAVKLHLSRARRKLRNYFF